MEQERVPQQRTPIELERWMKMESKPLDDLEVHELLRLIYPEYIRSDDDEYFELSQDVCEFATVDLGNDVEVSLADLLGRVVMLTMPMESGITKRLSHCLGEVIIKDGAVNMISAVRRDVSKQSIQHAGEQTP